MLTIKYNAQIQILIDEHFSPKNGTLTKAYGILKEGGDLEKFYINRRILDPYDICVLVKYCGICHSDLHLMKNEWKTTKYPFIPGHEIVGAVVEVGSKVTKFKIGDFVGINMYDSCRNCKQCKRGFQQYCENHMIISCGSEYHKDGGAVTCGGFSEKVVVDENYAIKIPKEMSLEEVAPLLCAGMTVFSPLNYLHVNENTRLAVVGLGGLGHLAVKFAKAMNAEVSVISRSAKKKEAAEKLGIKDFIVSTDKQQMEKHKQKFDVIVDTASAKHDVHELVDLLDVDGTLVLLGAITEPFDLPAIPMIMKRRKILGSCISSIEETQEMIDMCHKNGIHADVDVITVSKTPESLEKLASGDTARRFVIDMSTL